MTHVTAMKQAMDYIEAARPAPVAVADDANPPLGDPLVKLKGIEARIRSIALDTDQQFGSHRAQAERLVYLADDIRDIIAQQQN